MIELSNAAESKLEEVLARNPGKYLHIRVAGDGCAGPYFELSLDEANSSEHLMTVNGINIFVSDDVKKYAEITTINIFVNPEGSDFR